MSDGPSPDDGGDIPLVAALGGDERRCRSKAAAQPPAGIFWAIVDRAALSFHLLSMQRTGDLPNHPGFYVSYRNTGTCAAAKTLHDPYFLLSQVIIFFAPSSLTSFP